MVVSLCCADLRASSITTTAVADGKSTHDTVCSDKATPSADINSLCCRVVTGELRDSDRNFLTQIGVSSQQSPREMILQVRQKTESGVSEKVSDFVLTYFDGFSGELDFGVIADQMKAMTLEEKMCVLRYGAKIFQHPQVHFFILTTLVFCGDADDREFCLGVLRDYYTKHNHSVYYRLQAAELLLESDNQQDKVIALQVMKDILRNPEAIDFIRLEAAKLLLKSNNEQDKTQARLTIDHIKLRTVGALNSPKLLMSKS